MSAALETNKHSQEEIVNDLGHTTKKAAAILAQAPTCVINDTLQTLAQSLRQNVNTIITENKKDISAGKKKGLTDAMLDRLMLNQQRIEAMASGVETVLKLDDPTEKVLWEENRPNGLNIKRISCPIGVLGMIYESRPNVTIDASILCLKSHNTVILRGGSESLHSSLALHKIIQNALEHNGLPKACVSMIQTTDREAVGAMLRSEHIDVMIPRGGKSLIERVQNEAKMPVFSHLDGICHIYVHPSARADTAKNVTLNAKMRRTGICGAMETLLIDQAVDKGLATEILQNIIDADCDIVGDETAQSLDNRVISASNQDWSTEYLTNKLSVKFVNDVSAAIDHINTFGSHHTDSILAEDETAVNYFLKNVDSGIVMHNASTQFADGGEFGMGAEIGIATGKMHARGPVGLEQLCTYKYHVRGNGQTRA